MSRSRENTDLSRPLRSVIFATLPLLVLPQAASSATAAEVVEKSHQAFYYAGADMKARVTMELIAANGRKRTRVLTMLRRNETGGREQRYFMYFHQPGDVRATTFLVWTYPGKDDDRWVFIPAVNMVRRLAASDSRSSFVGSDFNYEDVSGRDVESDTHTLVREEELDGVPCYVIRSVPKTSAEYVRKLAWIDKSTFLPKREEYYDSQKELARVFTAHVVEVVGGYPTVVKRTMEDVKRAHRTEVTFEQIEYEMGLPEGIFTQRSLQQPPRKWIQ
ncbi:MAG: outer membrane lipoprotein-sorting protein [Bryobacteraceae bacterium]|nr:outer membrane lipoprotein-sorting protein [Bryobacteraceae bacterium]